MFLSFSLPLSLPLSQKSISISSGENLKKKRRKKEMPNLFWGKNWAMFLVEHHGTHFSDRALELS